MISAKNPKASQNIVFHLFHWLEARYWKCVTIRD